MPHPHAALMRRGFLAKFGELMILRRDGAADRTITVIFRSTGSQGLEIPIDGGRFALPVSGAKTMAYVSPDTDVQRDDRLLYGGQLWRVHDIQPDGGALNMLELKE